MGPEPPSLREVQARFYDWVTRRAPASADEVAPVLAAQHGMAAPERVGVYARMYFDRIAAALAEVFPKLVKLVGDDAFRELVGDYLRERAPACPMLQRAGAHLSPFVASHPLGARHPWLAELAYLEWARFAAVDAPDSAPLREGDLRSLDQALLARLPLRLVAAHAIVESGYASDRLWRAIHEGRPHRPPRAAAAPTVILVWRREVVVLHRRLTPFEAAIARLAERGGTLGEACELAYRKQDSVAEAARRVFLAVGRFVSEEVLASP